MSRVGRLTTANLRSKFTALLLTRSLAPLNRLGYVSSLRDGCRPLFGALNPSGLGGVFTDALGLDVVEGEPHCWTVEQLLLTLLAVIGLNNLMPKAVQPHGLLVAQQQRLCELRPIKHSLIACLVVSLRRSGACLRENPFGVVCSPTLQPENCEPSRLGWVADGKVTATFESITPPPKGEEHKYFFAFYTPEGGCKKARKNILILSPSRSDLEDCGRVL